MENFIEAKCKFGFKNLYMRKLIRIVMTTCGWVVSSSVLFKDKNTSLNIEKCTYWKRVALNILSLEIVRIISLIISEYKK